MIHTLMDTLNTSFPEVSWKLIDPNAKTQKESFSLNEVIYPDCFIAVEGELPPKSEVEAEMNRLNSEWEAQEYARKRQEEYPSIQECVHAILDDDLTALQEKRQAVKEKFPKSG